MKDLASTNFGIYALTRTGPISSVEHASKRNCNGGVRRTGEAAPRFGQRAGRVTWLTRLTRPPFAASDYARRSPFSLGGAHEITALGTRHRRLARVHARGHGTASAPACRGRRASGRPEGAANRGPRLR